jgi:hypothetical protein
MSCASFGPSIVDLARGIAPDAPRRTSLDRHLRECATCAARLEAERAMTAALRRAGVVEIPAHSPGAESALLAEFDAHHAGRVPLTWRFASWTAAASVAGLTALVAATMARQVGKPPRSSAPLASRALSPSHAQLPSVEAGAAAAIAAARRVPPPVAAADAAFIVWPGASALPAFESGDLMRVELPASVAVSLGLAPRARAARVQADVLVGQDGYVRAVRLAP